MDFILTILVMNRVAQHSIYTNRYCREFIWCEHIPNEISALSLSFLPNCDDIVESRRKSTHSFMKSYCLSILEFEAVDEFGRTYNQRAFLSRASPVSSHNSKKTNMRNSKITILVLTLKFIVLIGGRDHCSGRIVWYSCSLLYPR
jgi:hypothetical protein